MGSRKLFFVDRNGSLCFTVHISFVSFNSFAFSHISPLRGHVQEEKQELAEKLKKDAEARLAAKQKGGKSSLVIDVKPWDDETNMADRDLESLRWGMGDRWMVHYRWREWFWHRE